MTTNVLTIATRQSPLALWQAHWVKAQLQRIHQNLSVELLGLTTQADKMLSTPLYKVGGKGLFVKELEEALFQGKADIAVHSMKDVPMVLPDGLSIPVMCKREDPRDAVVSNDYTSFEELPINAVVGTSSLRRQSQLLALRPDLRITFLRGNVNTRLAKLDNKEYAAIVLAAAGLKRLGLTARIGAYLSIEQSLPAPGQGVLGIECREKDTQTQKLIAPLNDQTSFLCVTAERAMCRYLGGGCHVPIAAYAELIAEKLQLKGLVAGSDGRILLRATSSSGATTPDELGITVAKELLNQGAQALLDKLIE
jgi:hydroxymethylbilane synthase